MTQFIDSKMYIPLKIYTFPKLQTLIAAKKKYFSHLQN